MITIQTLAANDGLEHWPIDDPIVSRAKVAHQFEKKESCYQCQMQIGCTSLSSTLTQRTMMQCLIKIEITQLEEVGQYYIQECRHVVAFFPHASTLETVALNPDVSAPYFLQKKDGEMVQPPRLQQPIFLERVCMLNNAQTENRTSGKSLFNSICLLGEKPL